MTTYRKFDFGARPSQKAPKYLSGARGRQSGNAALSHFQRKLRELPMHIMFQVANRSAERMTAFAREDYASGRTAYSDPRPRGVDGRRLTLRESGATARQIRFKVVGTQVRCDLGEEWRRFLIGKYGILPNGSLPARWDRELNRISEEEYQLAVGGK